MPEPADLAPVPITHASFQAAVNFEGVSSDERRRRRRDSRADWLPPGLLASEWAVATPFFYDFGGPRSGDRHIVEAGFEFDGASVPFPLTILVPQTHSLYLAAAALHDWLYARERGRMSREKADAIFREAMIVCGANWFWAGLMWRAVRAGGWASWHAETPGTFAWLILQLPTILRVPLVWTITVGRGFGGFIFEDLRRWRDYRREAAEIRRADAPRAG